jgi:hypothetical protein
MELTNQAADAAIPRPMSRARKTWMAERRERRCDERGISDD